MRVTIDDVNDNTPIFTPGQATTAVVSENASIGSAVFQVFATDADASSRFGRLTYSLPFGGSGKFRISDANLGTVSVADTLNREAQATFEVVVRATDGGEAGNVSFVDFNVTVSVSDVNDCAPVFEQPGVCAPSGATSQTVYNCSIQEAQGSTCVGDLLVVGRVTDADEASTPASAITYSFLGGSTQLNSFFTIDSRIGLISLASPIDASVTPTLNLVVVATDGGSPGLTAFGIVHVTVIPTNRLGPIILSSNTMEISENIPASVFAPAPVGQVTATDPDGADSEILFTIDHSASSAGSTLFVIDASTGIPRFTMPFSCLADCSHFLLSGRCRFCCCRLG